MKHRLISVTLTACALLLGANPSMAADSKATAAQPAASSAKASPKVASSSASAKPKAATAVKLVDINSAKKEELKTLPGITDAKAANIIAGRPYGSKAWLVDDKLLTQEEYLAISKRVIAKQPFKDGAKNAELYRKKASQ